MCFLLILGTMYFHSGFTKLLGKIQIFPTRLKENKGQNGTSHDLFRQLYACQEICKPPKKLHNVKTVVRKL